MIDHRCRFCGGDASEANHRARCDGRQGGLFEDLPLLISGLSEETWTTSEAAAIANDDSIRASQRERVFAEIRRAGLLGKTDDELQVELGLDGSSERPRRRELEMLQRIAILRDAHGDAIRRRTRTQRRAVVWVDRRLCAEATR